MNYDENFCTCQDPYKHNNNITKTIATSTVFVASSWNSITSESWKWANLRTNYIDIHYWRSIKESFASRNVKYNNVRFLDSYKEPLYVALLSSLLVDLIALMVSLLVSPSVFKTKFSVSLPLSVFKLKILSYL